MQSNIQTKAKSLLLGGLFVFSIAACQQPVTNEAEEEALAFLYEYMPLPDSVDYSREFWQASVKATLKAKEEMPWGKTVPEREWRHFVLPLRVNNENLDSARIVFYDLLRDRVKNLSMHDAVLEVNHWCHEHVIYAPSNSRTKSPLVTMRTATGRCGEESTFTVSALRAVGIPARQVYTPRWAHTDDNHAWVEAWVDGKWYFLGACEPEPELNMAWFNAPASRGMLMHTKVFGHYDGPEEVVGQSKCYTEINVTANYAAVDTIVVKVTGQDGQAVADARVDYRLYNYAEFYSLVSKQTDAEGLSSLSCGLGDLVVWASKDGVFGFEKASVGQQDTVTVVLNAQTAKGFDLDLTPPHEKPYEPELSAEQIRDNRLRLKQEDSIRNAYMAEAFFQGEDLKCHEAKARSNWRTIAAFKENGGKQNPVAEQLLGTLCDKDLQDVSMEVLLDHAQIIPAANPLLSSNMDHAAMLESYVLAPRVSNEMLTPYRQPLAQAFAGCSVQELISWVQDSIQIDESRNPQHLCMTPLGVYRHRVTDKHSRDIFFVSAARSAGLIARIDEVTGKVQRAGEGDVWHDVQFESSPEDSTPDTAPQGTLTLNYKDFNIKDDPSYYTHFSLSRIQNGRPQLQEFPEEGCTWQSTFRDGVKMDAGQYMLVSGTRMASGEVLAHVELFQIPENGRVQVPLKLRNNEAELRVIGNFNCENYFTNVRGVHKQILQTTGRGYYVVGLLRSNHEPSTHILHDFEQINFHLSAWPHCFLMLFPSQEEYAEFKRSEFDELPANFVFGVADPETVEAMHIPELTNGSTELPILMMADSFNRVVWFHQGYTIGIGEQVMSIIRQVMEHCR